MNSLDKILFIIRLIKNNGYDYDIEWNDKNNLLKDLMIIDEKIKLRKKRIFIDANGDLKEINRFELMI